MADPVLKLDGDGPLYEQVRRAIAHKITSRQWRPGDRIPFENQLSLDLNISRMTVNKALQSLADDGLIVRRRKAGSFVATQENVQAPLTIVKIEDEVTASGKRYEYELISRADTNTKQELDLGEIFQEKTRIVRVECLHLADGSPVQHEERYINLETVPAAAGEAFDKQPPGSWLLSHVPWTEAEHKISAIQTPPELSSRLGIQPGSACLRIERRTWGEGETITFVRLTYASQHQALVGRFQPGYR